MSDSKPMKLTDTYLKHPCKFIMSALTILSILTGIYIYMGYYKQIKSNSRDYLIWSDERVEAFDKLTLAEEYLLGSTDGISS